MIHELRAHAHQSVPSTDHGQVRGDVLAAVLERGQQERIEPGHACEKSGIDAIGLSAVLENHSKFAGIRDEDLMSELLQQATHPWRMGPDLHRDTYACQSREALPQPSLRRCQPTLFDDRPLLVEDAVVTRAVTEV